MKMNLEMIKKGMLLWFGIEMSSVSKSIHKKDKQKKVPRENYMLRCRMIV